MEQATPPMGAVGTARVEVRQPIRETRFVNEQFFAARRGMVGGVFFSFPFFSLLYSGGKSRLVGVE